MDESTALCVAASEGVDCRAEAAVLDPVPLCDEHRLQIALQVVPDVLVAALRQAGAAGKPTSLPPAERAAIIAGATPRPVGAYFGSDPHGPVVYFADTGERIKIGFSTNLRNRVRSLSLQEKDVVLLLQGGLILERAMQGVFEKERIDTTEWFVKSDRLMGFIQSKQAELPDGRRYETQHARRKRMVTSASPSGPSAAGARTRRSLPEWAALAAPLYQRFAAEHGGATPSAPALADLLRKAFPNLRIPASERSERLIRAAVEELLAADQGKP